MPREFVSLGDPREEIIAAFKEGAGKAFKNADVMDRILYMHQKSIGDYLECRKHASTNPKDHWEVPEFRRWTLTWARFIGYTIMKRAGDNATAAMAETIAREVMNDVYDDYCHDKNEVPPCLPMSDRGSVCSELLASMPLG